MSASGPIAEFRECTANVHFGRKADAIPRNSQKKEPAGSTDSPQLLIEERTSQVSFLLKLKEKDGCVGTAAVLLEADGPGRLGTMDASAGLVFWRCREAVVRYVLRVTI